MIYVCTDAYNTVEKVFEVIRMCMATTQEEYSKYQNGGSTVYIPVFADVALFIRQDNIVRDDPPVNLNFKLDSLAVCLGYFHLGMFLFHTSIFCFDAFLHELRRTVV